MVSETRKVFHEELAELRSDVVRLAALASESIQAGTRALLDFDLAAVERLIRDDRIIDALADSIEERACMMLARQQPMAGDLRTLVAILRLIHGLERIGDNMINVGRAARRLDPAALDPRIRGLIERMREQATIQLRTAAGAFAEGDSAIAATLPAMDDVMDELQRELFRAIFDSGQRGATPAQQAVQLALVGRYFERVADQAVGVAERVGYIVTGRLHHDEHESANRSA